RGGGVQRVHGNPATLVTPTVRYPRPTFISWGRTRGGKCDDAAQDGDARGVAAGAPRAARGGEGAHAAKRRGGPAAAGAAVGSHRQGISVRYRPVEGLARPASPRDLSVPR